jgi:hypothetical protein
MASSRKIWPADDRLLLAGLPAGVTVCPLLLPACQTN